MDRACLLSELAHHMPWAWPISDLAHFPALGTVPCPSVGTSKIQVNDCRVETEIPVVHTRGAAAPGTALGSRSFARRGCTIHTASRDLLQVQRAHVSHTSSTHSTPQAATLHAHAHEGIVAAGTRSASEWDSAEARAR